MNKIVLAQKPECHNVFDISVGKEIFFSKQMPLDAPHKRPS